MAAVPIYVWNGSAWQETGPTIPANPIKYQASAPSSPSTGDIWVDSDADVTTGSQQFQRFRFVASGGETTISGADANGAVLAYTAGLEQVVLNGAVLVRGSDYTATTGTTITGLSPALVASDVLEVFSFIAFTVANTYTQSQVDGLITGPAFFAFRTSSSQSITANVSTKVQFNAESYDTHGCFDSSTNYRFTPTVAGYYQFNSILLLFGNSGATCSGVFVKNGTEYGVFSSTIGTDTARRVSGSTMAYMNGTTDYMELNAYVSAGTTSVGSGVESTQFNGCMIRKA
jgi:hypothetical protein